MSPARPPSSRAAALQVLCRAEQSNKPIDASIRRYAEKLSPADRQLLVNIVYGVLRNRDYLDFIAGRFSRHPLRGMKDRTRNALRIGIYQLLFLSRIPASAAVNETVAALKAYKQPRWLIGFVNGVLRNISRNAATLPRPDQATLKGRPILNHPSWLVKRWQARYGRDQTLEICRHNNRPPRLVLRVNRERTDLSSLMHGFQEQGIDVEPGRFAPDSLVLPGFTGAVTTLPGFAEGFFQVQDQAAQLIVPLFGPIPSGARLLDACAGLGGKTTHLAALMPEGRELVAVEPEARRFTLLQENLRRLHVEQRVCCRHCSLQDYAQRHRGHFWGILIDAPCSGTGVIGRHPDIRWNRQPGDLRRYQRQQRALLDQAAALLTPGGVLVYATCSLEGEENEEVIFRFLRDHPGYELDDCRLYLPEQARSLVTEHGFFATTPAQGLDGFFAARLQQRN